MLRLGSLLDRRGKIDQAELLYRETLAADRKVLGEKHPDTVTLTNNLAAVLQEKGDFAEAEELYRSAIRLGGESQGETADLALWRSNLAGLLTEELRYPEARTLLDGSIGLCRSKLGPGSLREARMIEKYGVLEERLRHWPGAGRQFEAALAIRKAKLGEDHPEIAATLFDMAELQSQQKRWEEAENLYRRALAIDRRALPLGHLQTAAHQLGYARMLAAAGRASEADALAREALAWRTKALPAGAWQIAAARSVLGGAEFAAGRYGDAEPLLVESFSSLKARLGVRTAATQEALARVSDMYKSAGKAAEESEYRQWIVKW
jgi:tetratricopeptide (TPR) repeat protein